MFSFRVYFLQSWYIGREVPIGVSAKVFFFCNETYIDKIDKIDGEDGEDGEDGGSGRPSQIPNLLLWRNIYV